MNPERYSSEEYLSKLTKEDVGRRVKIKWPTDSDDVNLSGEREAKIASIRTSDTAIIDYRGVQFPLTRFCMKGAQ